MQHANYSLGLSKHRQTVRVSRGFTLIELMVVLALAGILTTLAIPSLANLVRGSATRAASDDIFNSLMLARSEAIKRNSRVVLCRSGTGKSCAKSGGWEQGWIVFGDRNNNASLDDGESLLSTHQALDGGVLVGAKFTVPGYVSYTPLGHANTVSGAMMMGHFLICSESAGKSDARRIILSSAGRARTTKATEPRCQ